jgi:hypothetical protein
MLAVVARFRMRTEVRPWPPVESAGLNVRQVVGRKIVAQSVPLDDGHPERVAVRIPVDARRLRVPLAKISCPLPSGL